MRVLHLIPGHLFGGIEINLVTLARFRGACPDLVADYGLCFNAKAAAELRNTGADVHILGAVRFSRPWTVRAARRRLAAVLRETPSFLATRSPGRVAERFGPAGWHALRGR
jgi:hypothetical protein